MRAYDTDLHRSASNSCQKWLDVQSSDMTREDGMPKQQVEPTMSAFGFALQRVRARLSFQTTLSPTGSQPKP